MPSKLLAKTPTLEGVAERFELHTADMRHLPFKDASFDVVVSSLAIHNVSGAGERAKALREAARVLKRGGKLAIADIRHTNAYASELEACGLKITERRSLGMRFGTQPAPGRRPAWLLRSSRRKGETRDAVV